VTGVQTCALPICGPGRVAAGSARFLHRIGRPVLLHDPAGATQEATRTATARLRNCWHPILGEVAPGGTDGLRGTLPVLHPAGVRALVHCGLYLPLRREYCVPTSGCSEVVSRARVGRWRFPVEGIYPGPAAAAPSIPSRARSPPPDGVSGGG